MKKLLTSLFLFIFLIAVAKAGIIERSEPYQVKHFNVKGNSHLEVNTLNGNIQVIGTEARAASIAVLVTDLDGNFDKAEIEKALKNYTISVKQEKNTILASAVRKTKRIAGTADLLISFRVNIPKKTSCTLNSNGGDVTLNNIKGNSKITTEGGNISLWLFTGGLMAESKGGAINLYDANGSLSLNSSGGGIILKRVAGDILARSEGGSITADVRELGKYLTLETNEGSLRASIPGSQGLNIDISGAQVKTDLSDFKGISEKDKVKGNIDGGGIPIKLRSESGIAELRTVS